MSNYRSSPATPTPHQFSFVGCFVDGTKDRVLSGEFVKHDDAMTTEVGAENETSVELSVELLLHIRANRIVRVRCTCWRRSSLNGKHSNVLLIEL